MLIIQWGVVGVMFLLLAAAWHRIPQGVRVAGELLISALALAIIIPGVKPFTDSMAGFNRPAWDQEVSVNLQIAATREETKQICRDIYVIKGDWDSLDSNCKTLVKRPDSEPRKLSLPVVAEGERPVKRLTAAQEKDRLDEVARDVCRANRGANCDALTWAKSQTPQKD